MATASKDMSITNHTFCEDIVGDQKLGNKYLDGLEETYDWLKGFDS
jgi:hypothetical protein